jgi:hypothetical protein
MQVVEQIFSRLEKVYPKNFGQKLTEKDLEIYDIPSEVLLNALP